MRHSKSYYLGCSLGGRQGIKAAEMFPDDFDGIVAGSPALDFNNLASWRASFFTITGSINSTDFIAASTWTNLIHNEILNQCDGLDGVIDGIIEDPDLCNFIPDTLLCHYKTPPDCLTPVQVEMVRKIFSPLYGEDGKLIYPAMQPGSEDMAISKLYAGMPFSYSEVDYLSIPYARKLILPSSGLVQIRRVQQTLMGSFHVHNSGRRRSRKPQPVEY
jgi:feruloyl esterase